MKYIKQYESITNHNPTEVICINSEYNLYTTGKIYKINNIYENWDKEIEKPDTKPFEIGRIYYFQIINNFNTIDIIEMFIPGKPEFADMFMTIPGTLEFSIDKLKILANKYNL